MGLVGLISMIGFGVYCKVLRVFWVGGLFTGLGRVFKGFFRFGINLLPQTKPQTPKMKTYKLSAVHCGSVQSPEPSGSGSVQCFRFGSVTFLKTGS